MDTWGRWGCRMLPRKATMAVTIPSSLTPPSSYVPYWPCMELPNPLSPSPKRWWLMGQHLNLHFIHAVEHSSWRLPPVARPSSAAELLHCRRSDCPVFLRSHFAMTPWRSVLVGTPKQWMTKPSIKWWHTLNSQCSRSEGACLMLSTAGGCSCFFFASVRLLLHYLNLHLGGRIFHRLCW